MVLVEPTVSVIIPTWNRAHTLEAAVRSALTQSHAPLEVLVCDDGSQDESRACVEAIGDARVQFLPGVHCGKPAIVRNRGIASARGEWLAFLDSDDTWHVQKLALQLRHASVEGCLAACSDARRVLPDGQTRGVLLGLSASRLSLRLLLRSNYVICSSALVHRSLLKRTGGFPEDAALVAAEDYALWLRVATLTDFALVAAPLVDYRDDPAASIRGRDPEAEQRRTRAVFSSYLRWSHPLARGAIALRWELARRSLHQLRARLGPGELNRS